MLTIRKSLLRHFGLKKVGSFDSPSVEMFAAELRESIQAREMCALVGSTGAGKNHLLRRVKADLRSRATESDAARDGAGRSVAWVHVHDLTPRHMKIQNVVNAVIFDLAENASLRSNFEARTRQCERLLFQTQRRGHQPVIVIDDAHRLSPESFATLKRLREAEFNSRPIQPAVVLIGWPTLAGMLDRHKEIAERTERILLSEEEGWMTTPERSAFLDAVFPGILSPQTRDLIAQEHRVPMSLERAVKDAMRTARDLGHEVVDERSVAPRLADVIMQSGASQREIGQEAGLSKASVSRAKTASEKGESTKHSDAVRRATERLNARKAKSNAEGEAVPA